MLLLISVLCCCKLELYTVIINHILNVFLVKYRQKLCSCNQNFNVVFEYKRSWKVLFGQLTNVVKIAHFNITFKIFFCRRTVVIL